MNVDVNQLSDEQWDQLGRDGFIHVKGVFKPEEAATIKSAVEAALDNAPFGRNEITGEKIDATRNNTRGHGMGEDIDTMPLFFAEDDIFVKIVDRPLIKNLVGRFLGKNYYINFALIRRARKGASRCYYHNDGNGDLIMAVVVDERGLNGGGTVVIKGTHIGTASPIHKIQDLNVPIEGEIEFCGSPGDVFFFFSDIDHARTANMSDRHNLQIIVNFTSRNTMPEKQFCSLLTGDLERFERLPPSVRHMLREYDGLPYEPYRGIMEKLIYGFGFDIRRDLLRNLLANLYIYRGNRPLPDMDIGFPRRSNAFAYRYKASAIKYIRSLRFRSVASNIGLDVVRSFSIGRAMIKAIKMTRIF